MTKEKKILSLKNYVELLWLYHADDPSIDELNEQQKINISKTWSADFMPLYDSTPMMDNQELDKVLYADKGIIKAYEEYKKIFVINPDSLVELVLQKRHWHLMNVHSHCEVLARFIISNIDGKAQEECIKVIRSILNLNDDNIYIEGIYECHAALNKINIVSKNKGLDAFFYNEKMDLMQELNSVIELYEIIINSCRG